MGGCGPFLKGPADIAFGTHFYIGLDIGKLVFIVEKVFKMLRTKLYADFGKLPSGALLRLEDFLRGSFDEPKKTSAIFMNA